MPWSDRIGARLKLRDLHVFMAVANAGTMGRAAAHLAISQPVISKAIADLEHTLGVRLFDRSRRGVELTDHGRVLRDSGIAVFDELRQSVARLEALTDPTAGEVRIGATEPLATGLVSAGLNRMASRYPRMKLHVVQADRNVLRTRDLPARRVDFAIAHILEPIGGDEFAVETLFNDSSGRPRWPHQQMGEAPERSVGRPGERTLDFAAARRSLGASASRFRCRRSRATPG